MVNVVYQEIKDGEEGAVSQLAERVFLEYVAPDYSPEGITTFIRFVEPESIRERLRGEGNFLITAKAEGRIIGIIEMREGRHINLLFVEKDYQKRGVASALVKRALVRCQMLKPGLKSITVNSSPYAVEIYKRMGFVKVEDEQEKDGIRYIPMKMDI